MSIDKWLWMIRSFAVAAGMLLGFGRPRPRYPTRKLSTHEWHRCGVCETLVRPREILCAEHLVLVPVPRRIWLAQRLQPGPLQTEAWLYGARDAVNFAFEASLEWP